MIFYDCSVAPNPRRARMFILEKGLEIETHDIPMGPGARLDPAYLEVNPGGTIPALVTDEGPVLTENLGIAAYLEARHPERPLMGRTALEKGEVLTWHAFAEFYGGAPVGEALRNAHPAFENRALPGRLDLPQIPALAERGHLRLTHYWDRLEERLTGREWLATDTFTLADITAFVFADFARVVKARIPETHTAATAWFERIKARPSAQA